MAIFKIEDEITRYKITFFGIKIKIQKAEYKKLRKSNPYYFYKRNKSDITKLPPAKGQIRDIQLANFTLLKKLDMFCKENNINYWLDMGTLLGAKRHKGFIPWDDDIDIGMIREDYQNFIEKFENKYKDSNLYLDFHVNKKKGGILKLRHKASKNIFIDIFPYDNCSVPKTIVKLEIQTNKIKKLLKRQKFNWEKTNKEIMDEIYNFEKTVINKNTANKNTYLIRGFEYGHSFKNWIFKKDIFYPLSEIEFEKEKFPCPNNAGEYLKESYGNYMNYPKKISLGHTMYAKLNDQEKEFIKNLSKIGYKE